MLIPAISKRIKQGKEIRNVKGECEILDGIAVEDLTERMTN